MHSPAAAFFFLLDARGIRGEYFIVTRFISAVANFFFATEQ